MPFKFWQSHLLSATMYTVYTIFRAWNSLWLRLSAFKHSPSLPWTQRVSPQHQGSGQLTSSLETSCVDARHSRLCSGRAGECATAARNVGRFSKLWYVNILLFFICRVVLYCILTEVEIANRCFCWQLVRCHDDTPKVLTFTDWSPNLSL